MLHYLYGIIYYNAQFVVNNFLFCRKWSQIANISYMGLSQIKEKLDNLYEFDREPVTKKRLLGSGNFFGMFAGEHVAGTEFVIGPLFVVHGVSAGDLFIGGLIGNLLAVLSWAFITAPIATKLRLSLYWHLKKICGSYLVFIYNIVNALMFCFLAGAMVAVSATAVGLPFNINMPGLNDWLPTGAGWIIIVLIVGVLITTIAILGFESLSRFSKVAAPWMILVFIASAVAVLPSLGMESFGDFWEVAETKIWTGIPFAGQSKFTIWHIIFFTWLCNAAMHIGMADLSVFRYAKKWYYGFTSAVGMFIGHYIAWIASGILCAAALGNIAPGPIAYNAAGLAGAITVVIAGWTTANPTLYRAGLALQVASPNWKRWKVTIIAGAITTIAALFPALVMKLLEFVALYGLILVPMGAVIFADFYLLSKFKLSPCYAEKVKSDFNIAAGITWLLMLGFALILNQVYEIEIFFLAVPVWIIALLIYILLNKIYQRPILITGNE